MLREAADVRCGELSLRRDTLLLKSAQEGSLTCRCTASACSAAVNENASKGDAG